MSEEFLAQLNLLETKNQRLSRELENYGVNVSTLFQSANNLDNLACVLNEKEA